MLRWPAGVQPQVGHSFLLLSLPTQKLAFSSTTLLLQVRTSTAWWMRSRLAASLSPWWPGSGKQGCPSGFLSPPLLSLGGLKQGVGAQRMVLVPGCSRVSYRQCLVARLCGRPPSLQRHLRQAVQERGAVWARGRQERRGGGVSAGGKPAAGGMWVARRRKAGGSQPSKVQQPARRHLSPHGAAPPAPIRSGYTACMSAQGLPI